MTQTLARNEPIFYGEVSEIDVSAGSMIVLRLEGRGYSLRLSPEDILQNLHNYFALREELAASEDNIEYVDLRWKGRIAVWPAEAVIEQDGGG